MTVARPLVSSSRDAFVAVIQTADTESKVHPEISNAKERKRIKELYYVADQIRAWFVEYIPQQSTQGREHPAGHLYYRIHNFALHHYRGPFNDIGQTGIDVDDVLNEVDDAITADQTIFGRLVPEVTQRTVTNIGSQKQKLHGIFVHHGILLVEITARLFKPV